jgi:hypothetical protein
MPENTDDDAIAILVGMGILAFVGVGLLVVLKAIGSYEPGELVSTKDASSLKSEISIYLPSRSSYYSNDDCLHGEDSEQCPYNYHQGSNRCVECNGGWGDSVVSQCKACLDYWY